MKIKDCMQGTLIGKEESIDVWLCRECRSGAKKEPKDKIHYYPNPKKQKYKKMEFTKEPKDYKKAMEYASCVDTQSHLKKCGKCKELKQEWGSEKEARDSFEKWLKQEYKKEFKKMIGEIMRDTISVDTHKSWQEVNEMYKKLENL